MIVVSNTSPLTNLAAINQFDLLRILYSRIHIAEGVWRELNAMGKPWPGSHEVASSEWVCRHTVRNQFLLRALRRDIDRGEAESIVFSYDSGLISISASHHVFMKRHVSQAVARIYE